MACKISTLWESAEGKVRIPATKLGFTSLIGHIENHNPNWKSEIISNDQPCIFGVSKRAFISFNPLEIVVLSDQVFSNAENSFFTTSEARNNFQQIHWKFFGKSYLI